MDPTASLAPAFPSIASRFSEAELAAFAGALQRKTLAAGEVLIREGETSRTLYLLKTGALRVSVQIDGRTFDLGRLEAGAVAGEVSLGDPGPSTATVTAEGEATVLVMDADGIDAVARTEPRVATALLRTMSETLSERVHSMEERIDEILLETDPQLSLVAEPRRESVIAYYFRTLFGGGS